MTDVTPARLATRARINGLAVLPAPIIVALILLAALGAPVVVPVLLGAAGWLAALIMRQPVALTANRLTTRERTATIVGWFSGPAEELVRLAVVLLAIRTVEQAAWAGFGWAAIEVLLVAVNTFVIASLLTKDDPKSREARQLLADQGMLVPSNPGWGLLERFSATALHLGFTLLLFAAPWLVLITLPLHSVTNMLTVKYAKSHLALTELALVLVGALVLTASVIIQEVV